MGEWMVVCLDEGQWTFASYRLMSFVEAVSHADGVATNREAKVLRIAAAKAFIRMNGKDHYEY